MGQSFRPIGGDDQLRIHAYQVTAGQTIAVGDPVFLDAGLLKVATTTTPALLGIAAEACTAAAAGTKLGVYDSPNLRCLWWMTFWRRNAVLSVILPALRVLSRLTLGLQQSRCCE
jgi:hypothetical protein